MHQPLGVCCGHFRVTQKGGRGDQGGREGGREGGRRRRGGGEGGRGRGEGEESEGVKLSTCIT